LNSGILVLLKIIFWQHYTTGVQQSKHAPYSVVLSHNLELQGLGW